MMDIDPNGFLVDLVRAFGDRGRTKYELVARLSGHYAIDTRTVNQWLYRYEGALFEKDRSPQEGLPIWSLTSLLQDGIKPPAPPGDETGLSIRPERWERLREWQREAIEAWLANDESGIVEAVTGAGKSDVGIALAEHYISQGGRVLVIVPNNTLKQQWGRRLREDVCDYLGIDVAEISKTASWSWRRSSVMIAHPSTVSRALETGRLDPNSVSLVVADEVHHMGARKWREALSEAFPARVGLSATIERADDGFEEVLEPYFDGVIYQLGFGRAYSHDLLAPFRMAYVGCAFSDAERAAYGEEKLRFKSAHRKLLKLHPDLEGMYGSAFFAEVSRLATGAGERSVGMAASALLSSITKMRSLRASCSGKLRALPEVLQIAAHREKGLVFTGTKQAAHEALQACAFAGVVGEMITSDTPKEDRPGILRRFEEGRTRVLIGPKTLDEGLDVPEADFGVIVAASQSQREMVQRFGRLLRKKPDGRDAAIVVLYAIDSNEDPTHPSRDGFIDDLEDLADPECRTFHADEDMGQLLDFLLPCGE